ncbi:hypothetical protein C1Y40_05805 [Mycobacterium talmoniae]|uniref:Uncharacterized protein n=1 Tax=Mycobacterium talmoniae TaxID=1858794 RepID=A0A2S8BBK2_9MYCO|nr:hypothetical protein C1Y40_05805 [Mycobacterium talmoniae]
MSATGTTPGRRRAGGVGAVWASVLCPVLNRAAAASTAPTNASTVTPTSRCVDLAHRVGRMTLLISLARLLLTSPQTDRVRPVTV